MQCDVVRDAHHGVGVVRADEVVCRRYGPLPDVRPVLGGCISLRVGASLLVGDPSRARGSRTAIYGPLSTPGPPLPGLGVEAVLNQSGGTFRRRATHQKRLQRRNTGSL